MIWMDEVELSRSVLALPRALGPRRTVNWTRWPASILILLALQGCDALDTQQKYEERIYEVGGSLCLSNDGPIPEFPSVCKLVAGTSKMLTVQYDACASGCTTVHASECSAVLQGNIVQVTAMARASLPKQGVGLDCPSVCVPILAACRVEGDLMPGVSYTLQYAEQSRAFVVPGDFACH